MNKYVIIAFLCLVISEVCSQEKVDPNGFNKFYYSDGTLSSEGSLLDGKPEGYWKNYYESGILKSEGNRKEFELDSTWKFYNEEGILTQLITYKAGKRNGETRKYNNEGFLVTATPFTDDLKQGTELSYFNNGSVREEIPFEKGHENGKAYEFNKKGDIITIRTYQNGILTRQENINRKSPGKEKNGLWKEFYEDRTVKSQGRFKNGERDGYWKEYSNKGLLLGVTKYKDGQLITDAEEISDLEVREQYYPDSDGQLKFRGTYRKGQAHGTHIWYSITGEIDSAKVYRNNVLIAEGDLDKNGLRQGAWEEFYYPTAELKAKGIYQNGYRFKDWVYYFQNGKIEQKGPYSAKGKPNGKWHWYYETGKILREETFRNGKENGWLIEYSDTGKVITRGEYVDGKEEGDWFYEIGDHLEQGLYEAGMKQGTWEHFFLSNGEKRFEGEYFDDLEQEKHVWYFDNGKKMLEGKYVSGVKEGEWRRYNKDGTIMVTIEYQSDVEIKVDGIKIKAAEKANSREKG